MSSQRQRKQKQLFIGPRTKPIVKKMVRTLKQAQTALKKKFGLSKLRYSGSMPGGGRVKGRGAYTFDNLYSDVGGAITKPFFDETKSEGAVNRGARYVGKTVGDTLGGSVVGDMLGNAGSWLSRAFGFGDYAIRSNSLANNNIAQFKNHGTIEFAHREFITDISSSTGFTNNSYPVNPGNSALFPWLSNLATNFEQYEFLGLIFEFKTTSAMAVGSVNTGLGTVIMATDYDVLDAPYLDKRAMEVSEFSTSAAPCYSQIHPIECDPKQNVMRQLFIQPGNSIAGYPDDPRFSAMGNFQIATAGMQAVSTIGELWVSYHIRLYKPQLETEPTGNPTSVHLKVIGEDASAPVLEPMITNNPGAFTASITGNRLLITCTSAKGLGAYVLGVGIISDQALGVITAPLAGTSPPVLVGATYVANAFDIIIGPPRNALWANAASSDANGVSATTYNGTSQLYVLKFNATGNTVSLPIYNTAAVTLFHDYYLAPYTTPGFGEKLNNKESDQISELRNMMQQLKIQQERSNAEFTQLKNEITDETDGEYDISTTLSTTTSPAQHQVVGGNIVSHRRFAQHFIGNTPR